MVCCFPLWPRPSPRAGPFFFSSSEHLRFLPGDDPIFPDFILDIGFQVSNVCPEFDIGQTLALVPIIDQGLNGTTEGF
jgi:hypothetical protein